MKYEMDVLQNSGRSASGQRTVSGVDVVRSSKAACINFSSETPSPREVAFTGDLVKLSQMVGVE